MDRPRRQSTNPTHARARQAFADGDVDAALAAIDEDGEEAGGGAEKGVARAIEWSRVFGRVNEALARVSPDASAATHARVADMLMSRDDTARAAEHLRIAIAREPRSASARFALADALGASGSWDEAAAALREALAVGGLQARARLREPASRLALRLGAFDDAASFAEASGERARDVLASLALFRGDAARATALAEKIMIESSESRALGHTLRGAARALAGDDRAALADFDAAIALDDENWEAHAWRGELLSRAGNLDAALVEIDHAIANAPGMLAGTRIARLLTTTRARAHPTDKPLSYAAFGEIAAIVATVCPDAREVLGRATPDELAPYLVRTLAAMRGNRTTSPTFMDGDRLVALRVAPGPRFASRRVLNLIATTDVDEVAHRLDAVIAAYPESGLPMCHRGELWLWAGRYDRARADLEDVVRRFPFTRWVYIGLATLDVLEGHAERAIATLALGIERLGGTTGPAVYGVRGEALRMLGRTSEAVADLETAIAVSPRRVSASIVLALAYDDLARHDDASALFARLRDRAYPLFYDAARACGLSIDAAAIDRRAVLERALAMLLGNRSSSLVTWRAARAARAEHFDSPIRCLVDSPRSRADILELRARELASAR